MVHIQLKTMVMESGWIAGRPGWWAIGMLGLPHGGLERKVNDGRYRQSFVPWGPYRIRVREYGGEGPAVVLMHGFPDNLHLYDRLVPRLSGRRVVPSTSSAGEGRTSRGAIRTRRTTRPGISTRSSGTWGSKMSCCGS